MGFLAVRLFVPAMVAPILPFASQHHSMSGIVAKGNGGILSVEHVFQERLGTEMAQASLETGFGRLGLRDRYRQGETRSGKNSRSSRQSRATTHLILTAHAGRFRSSATPAEVASRPHP